MDVLFLRNIKKEFMTREQGQEKRFQRKVLKLFEGAGVDRRYSIMDAEEVFSNSSFEEKNNIYAREVTALAEQSLKKSLKKSSKGEPGGNFGAPGAAGSNDIEVDILTTAGESLAESSEKSGG